MTDWRPGLYLAFERERMRPALDLLAGVDLADPWLVIDLGCGAGGMAPVFRARWPETRLMGVDSSPAMLKRARALHKWADWAESDIASWEPHAAPDLIFSNAALHWLPDHERLYPRLFGMLAPKGVFAVQIPVQHDAPSHRLLRRAAEICGLPAPERPVHARGAAFYHDLLEPLAARVDVWETTYLHRLAPTPGKHPVRAFTESAAARPWLEGLTPLEAKRFLKAYDALLEEAYPLRPDGGALFPFRRLFVVAVRLDEPPTHP